MLRDKLRLSSYLHLSFVQQLQHGVELEAIAEVALSVSKAFEVVIPGRHYLRLPCLLVEIPQNTFHVIAALDLLDRVGEQCVLTAALDGRLVGVLVNELKRPLLPQQVDTLEHQALGAYDLDVLHLRGAKPSGHRSCLSKESSRNYPKACFGSGVLLVGAHTRSSTIACNQDGVGLFVATTLKFIHSLLLLPVI